MCDENESKDTTKTAFSILTVHFPDPGDKLKTVDFLEASTGVVTIVEKFGKVFSPVVNDMNGNIKKLQQKYNEDCESHHHLEDMILKEQIDGDILATDALLWLRRGLNFLSTFFNYIIIDSESERLSQDLTPFLKKAYSESLERYHGWLGSQLFNVLSRFAPTRKTLLLTLALDQPNKDEQVLEDMKYYQRRMAACVVKLSEFYHEHQLDSL